jgi:diadenosine tetraphosphate (Ap4A) HIT family hydrolase
MDTCFVCRKHNGQEPAPPGGYIYEDAHWMVCHAPAKLGPLGTLFIESRRHFLNYAEMTAKEAAFLGGAPHFHCWILPRRRDVTKRGLKFLARDDSCDEQDAIALVEKLREAMKA